jgi:hypothetical protein
MRCVMSFPSITHPRRPIQNMPSSGSFDRSVKFDLVINGNCTVALTTPAS